MLEEIGLKHAILILAHKNLFHLRALMKYFHTDCYFFIHLDKRCTCSDKEVEELKKLPGVVAVYRKYRIHWGGFNVLKGGLFLLKQALENCDAEYFHLISGQDYPVKPFNEFLRFFERWRGTEFIEYMSLPSMKWEGGTYRRFQYFWLYDWIQGGYKRNQEIANRQERLGIKRRIPDQFDRLYGGSAWFSLTRECTAYLMNYTRTNPAFYKRLKYTFAPDETYVSTVLVNSPFRSKIENNNYRYIRWKRENGNYPANLSEMHFGELVTTHAFFARKFDYPWCEKLIPLIDRYLIQETSITVSQTGSWEHSTLTGYHFDRSLCNAFARFCKLADIESAVDLGCGPGSYVAALRRERIPIVGYDGNPHVEEISRLILRDEYPCERADLTDDLTSDEPFDLVLCLDVCAYIPAEYEEQLIQNIALNSGKYIILSWAGEDRGQKRYVNLRSAGYVIQKFVEQGFVENIPVKNYLREQVSLPWLKDCLFVFQR